MLTCIIIQKSYPLQLFKFMMITLDVKQKIQEGLSSFQNPFEICEQKF